MFLTLFNAHIYSHMHPEIEKQAGWSNLYLTIESAVDFCLKLLGPVSTFTDCNGWTVICTPTYTLKKKKSLQYTCYKYTHTNSCLYGTINKIHWPKDRQPLLFQLYLLLQGQIHLDALDDGQSNPSRPCSYVPFNELKQCAVLLDGRQQGIGGRFSKCRLSGPKRRYRQGWWGVESGLQ